MISTSDLDLIFLLIAFTIGLVGAFLAGAGSVSLWLTRQRHSDLMPRLEAMHDKADAKVQRLVVTVENITALLGNSIPESSLRDLVLAVSAFADEISDGVPVVDKTDLVNGITPENTNIAGVDYDD